jgi:hypothetical protein
LLVSLVFVDETEYGKEIALDVLRFEVFTAVAMKNVVFWNVAMKREAIRSSETSVNAGSTQRHIQEEIQQF